MSDLIKGKKNKLKVGQEVRATKELVKWFSSHLCWSYGRRTEKKDGYSEGEKEIGLEDLGSVYIWIRAFLSGEMPKGVVRHYGADSDRTGFKCVWVEFIFKTELGTVMDATYVEESNLVAIKKPKSRKR